MTRPRALFFGTPEFAVPCLEALLEVAHVVMVVSQPDRPAGRGLKLRPPAVKVLATERGLPVLQPSRVRTEELAKSLRELRADVAVVVAYGRILPRAVLDAPRLGCVNVHASLLPHWRGAAPINWSIVHGDQETGVCLMQMDEGMDTGPVLHCLRTPIGPDETAGDLSARLSQMGGTLVREQLPRYLDGELDPHPQDHAAATHAPLMKKDDGELVWSASARQIHDRVRGLSPWTGAYTFAEGRRLKVHGTHVVDASIVAGASGQLLRADRHGIEIACGEGILALDHVQLEGKRRMSAAELLAGHRWAADTRFGS